MHLGVLRDGVTVRDDTCVVMSLVLCPTYSSDTVIYSSKATQEMEEFIGLSDYNPSSREYSIGVQGRDHEAGTETENAGRQ